MSISSLDEATEALSTIGYFRLKGYCFHWYDNTTKKFLQGTTFSNLLLLYRFDMELSNLILQIISEIEITLRARLVESLLIYNDPIIFNDPSIFEDKSLFWNNMTSISSEIARSRDVFISHNFFHHEGQIPVWAMVEVISFGTLSKIIKNLKAGTGSAYSSFSRYYRFKSQNNNFVTPKKKTLSSWIRSVSILRNICAHNSRIYNRSINVRPELLFSDKIIPEPQYSGLYQILLAVKYIRPSDIIWQNFVDKIQILFEKYNSVIDLSKISFPSDWLSHFQVWGIKVFLFA